MAAISGAAFTSSMAVKRSSDVATPHWPSNKNSVPYSVSPNRQANHIRYQSVPSHSASVAASESSAVSQSHSSSIDMTNGSSEGTPSGQSYRGRGLSSRGGLYRPIADTPYSKDKRGQLERLMRYYNKRLSPASRYVPLLML